jgi:hypothetical protein
MDFNLVLNRLLRLAQLDTSPFDEVRDDQRELIPAIAIVAVSALLASIGPLIWLLIEKPSEFDLEWANAILYLVVLGTIFTVVLWAVWVGVTGVLLQSVFKEQVDMMALFRTMGYASFPFALSFVMLVPALSTGVGLAALVAWFVLSIFAVQAASGADSGKVIKSAMIGFVVFAVLFGLFARATGIASGVFVFSEGPRAIAEGEYWKFEQDDFSCAWPCGG